MKPILPLTSMGRILLVEDNPNDAESFILSMRRFPIEIVHVSTGTDAQRLLRNNQNFRVVFVDLGIPCMDGLDLVRWIKDRYPQLPLAILSGVEEERSRARGMDVGAIFIFSKPFASADLQAVLNLIDVVEAVNRLARKSNWRTNVAGIVTVLVAGALMFKGQMTGAVGFFAVGIGLLCAQDSMVFGKLIEKKKE